jgi:pimeloyl-ACP methyl ester carboxylesterase
VGFPDSFGNSLGGILHRPPGGHRNTGVVIVVSGVKDRAGPNRIYHRLATDLARRGYPVLRFDPCGIGESDGVMGNHRTSFHFSWIQKGLFDDSIARALDFFRAQTGVKDVVLAGLSGGATAAVLADGPGGAAGYILLAPSAVFDDVRFEAGLLDRVRRGRRIDRDSADHLRGYVMSTLRKRIRLWSGRRSGDRKICEADVNFCFTRRFDALVKTGKPVLCVVIDNDPTCREFETFVLDRYRSDDIEVFRVGGVGHEFGSVEVVESLKGRIGGWLEALLQSDRSA